MAHRQGNHMEEATWEQEAADRRCARHEDYIPCLSQQNVSCQSKDIVKMRRQNILFLEAKIAEETVELMKLAHSCVFCDNRLANADYLTPRALTLPEALVEDTRKKLREMEVMAARIRNHAATTKHLKRLDGGYRCDCGNATAPIADRVVKPLIDIDSEEAYIKEEQKPEPSSPYLEPVSGPEVLSVTDDNLESTTSPIITPAQAATAPVSLNFVQADGILQIWDTREECYEAKRMYTRGRRSSHIDDAPLVFRFGIHHFNASHNKPNNDDCRMVVFQDVDPNTKIQTILDNVRGGQILSAGKPSPTMACVSFVRGKDAHAYVSHVNSLRMTANPRITLAGTPSYPLRESFQSAIAGQGMTRGLGFRNIDDEVLSFLLEDKFHKMLDQTYGPSGFFDKSVDELPSGVAETWASPVYDEKQLLTVFFYRSIEFARSSEERRARSEERRAKKNKTMFSDIRQGDG
ncbi:hypothetical protein GGR50DRAFT_694249 [Xylaria sp. CBS 124048]|nr:hypothetical protein GGR50DRAFT_694249 [Xylaria sp. CBS 124048]